MKKLLFISVFTLLASVFSLKAQEGTDECMLYMSYYQEYYKQGTKDSRMAAIPSWRKAYSICAPGTRQNLYIHGAALYRMLISQNAKNKEYRDALIDTLVTLHKLRAQYYTKYADKAYSALAADVNNYLKGNPEKTYEILSEIVQIQGAKAEPVTFTARMNAAVALYKAGKLDAEKVIEDYDVAVNAFTEIQKADTTQNTRNLRTTMENAFINSKVASCENLIALFGPRYEAAKNDIAVVSKIVKLMATSEGCTDNELFLNAVTSMHQLEPSANSAYYLYRLHSAKNNKDKALEYIAQAASSADITTEQKAQYNYEMAAYSLKNGLYAKAVNAASAALEADGSYAGKCYMVMGHAWMSISCSGNEFEVRAKYWVAADYFSKAAAADESLKEDAYRQAGACSSYYPAQADAFMYDYKDGDTFKVSCGGMTAVTRVRTK